MLSRISRPVAVLVMMAITVLPCATFSQASHDKKKKDKTPSEKNIWNYDGGIYFQSDGGIPDGPCFRISGRVTSGDFFFDLKRLDYDDGDSLFQRGKDKVTQFPDRMRMEFTIRDFPCSLKTEDSPPRGSLTRKQIETLGVTLFWKDGVEMSRAALVTRPQLTVHHAPAPTYAGTEQLPVKFEWLFVYDIASTGMPITDSLVVVMRTPEGKIAARFAARM